MRSDAISNLLLEVYPLIGQARGEQRSYLRQAWVSAANEHAPMVLKQSPELMPLNEAEAAKAMLAAALIAAKGAGLSNADLADLFNERVDHGDLMGNVHPDDSLTALHALVAFMAARRLQAREPASQEAKLA